MTQGEWSCDGHVISGDTHVNRAVCGRKWGEVGVAGEDVMDASGDAVRRVEVGVAWWRGHTGLLPSCVVQRGSRTGSP